MKIINFTDFCKSINKKLLNSKSVITIGSIYEHLLMKKEKWNSIKYWQDFEQGVKEYSEEEIVDLFLFEEIKQLSDEVILVTMESYTKNIVFKIKNKEGFKLLIRNYDEIIQENIDFMQPMDYILMSSNLDCFVLIHHEGLRVKVSTS